jgi:oxygen-independent coproporphyrinogen-3 oxidase
MSVGTTRGEAAYAEAVCRQLCKYSTALPGVELDTVFFGGGTPGLLDPELTRSIMEEIHRGFAVAPGAEITIEVNPSSTSERRATAWLEAGFNRVSMGIQSLQPDILAFLDRVHDAPRALAALDDVRRAGFNAVSGDLIHSVPGLDDERWRSTLDQVLAADPGHMSCYELTVEEGTPLHVAVSRGAVRPVDAETALRQHRIAADVAAAAGYGQYEVSNFARSGRECRHNLVYWDNGCYLACGVGAHGNLPPDAAAAVGFDITDDTASVRYWYGRSIPAFVSGAHQEGFAVRGHECVSTAAAERERVMLGLRRTAGVSLRDRHREEASALADAGLLLLDGDRARLTRRGREVLNAVALRLCAV